MAIVTKNVEVAGRRLSIETGRVAEQANGAVILRQGDTVVLSTAVMAKEPREGIDWFPLTCDYEEKLYAAGKIPGAFMRREGRPSETAILAYLLWQRPGRRHLHPWMVGLFLALTIASLAGGLVHAFYTDASTAGHAVLWPLTLIAIGATAVCLAVIAARLGLSANAAGRFTGPVLILFAVYIAIVLFVKGEFIVAICGYAPAVLFLLVVLTRLWLRNRQRAFLLGVVAVLLTIVASAVQQATFAIPGIAHANNVLYHVIEGIALVILYRAFRGMGGVYSG